MQRVSVVGTSGSGKSTLARAIAEVLDAPHIELDSIYHQPGWKPLPREQFVARVAEVAAGERWVVCGNYKSVRDVLWTAADTVVWLDLPRGVTARRIISRSLRRAWTREELWNGNRERWLNLFLPVPKHNVVLWSL
ncbi:MAG: adenylate kinase, partial [Planctomycetota bacterium]